MNNLDQHKKSLDILDNFLATTPKEELDEFLKSFSSEKTIPEENPEYSLALTKVSNIPQFHIGQQLTTKIGIGIITSLTIPFNGLSIYPEKAMATVWFGVGTKNGMVSREFQLIDLIKENMDN